MSNSLLMAVMYSFNYLGKYFGGKFFLKSFLILKFYQFFEGFCPYKLHTQVDLFGIFQSLIKLDDFLMI
jgi:hypothetical protein